ncbi:Alpha-19 giardin [Giardia lamblia P15]|uniref:Alpha-19 giardin n=1 Tax=Giardia intestinalis (strain P15) TaxID=658858 RepID=E1EW40_GIAIA|nr:Alpha-19 giardin [Giardia lamblia P15]
MGCAASNPDVVDATVVMGTSGQEKSRTKGMSSKGISLKSMESIKSAIESLLINELELTRLMTSFSKEHLFMFAKDYQTQTGTDLLSLLREKLNGPLEKIILSSFKPDVTLRTELIRESLQGKATDIEQLTDVVLTLSESKACEIAENYDLLYGGSVITDIRHDYNGDKLWQRLVIRILSSKRASRLTLAMQSTTLTSDGDADTHAMGTETSVGTLGKLLVADAERLVMDIRERNFEHLLLLMATALPTEYVSICKKYFEMKGTVLRQDITDALEHRPEERYALLLAHDYLHSPATAYAFMAHTALVAGISRDDARLTRAAILSYEEHPDVPAAYHDLYGVALEDAIERTGTGSYESTLLILWRIDKAKDPAVVVPEVEDGATGTTAHAGNKSKQLSKGSKKNDSKVNKEGTVTSVPQNDAMEERLLTPTASEPSTLP